MVVCWLMRVLKSVTEAIPGVSPVSFSFVFFYQAGPFIYFGWDTLDNKIWTYWALHAVSLHFEAFLTLEDEVGGRCFGHLFLKQPVLLGLG